MHIVGSMKWGMCAYDIFVIQSGALAGTAKFVFPF